MGAFLFGEKKKEEWLVDVLALGLVGRWDAGPAGLAGPAHRVNDVDGQIPKHIRDYEEANMAASNVDLLEMGDATVASGDSDILELDIHVVLG